MRVSVQERWIAFVAMAALLLGSAGGTRVLAAEVDSDLAPPMRSTIPPPNLKVSSWLLMDAATGLTLAANNEIGRAHV